MKRNIIIISLLGAFLVVGILILSQRAGSKLDKPKGILSDSTVKELSQKHLRNQVISFRNLQMLDSANNIYFLEAIAENLEEPEKLNTSESSHFEGGNYGGSEAPILDLLVYSQNSDSVHSIFNRRMSISSYKLITIHKEKMLLVLGTESDSNKDGLLNHLDLGKAYLYLPKTKQLRTISVENGDVRSFHLTSTGQIIFFEVGMDYDKDGIFSPKRDIEEPVRFYKYTIADNQLSPLIPHTLTDKLQKILDGK